MTAQTVAERVAALRQRRLALGLVRMEIYVHPADRQEIMRLAKELERKRRKLSTPSHR